MAKQKKKRNKVYRGADAKLAIPQVHRYEAVERSRLGQWWFDRKKFLKPVIIGTVVVVFLVWLIVSFIVNL